MKIPALLGMVILGWFGSGLTAGPRDAAWARVEDALQKKWPETARAELPAILAGAMADQAWAEAVDALLRQIVLEEPDHPARIARLETQVETVPAAMRPVLNTVLAIWYSGYYMQTVWKLQDRTPVTGDPDADLSTSDAPRILAKVESHFAMALAAEERLLATPIGEYARILDRGIMPERYRPTLYDLIAHEALDFYKPGETSALHPHDAFRVEDSSPIFDKVEDFLAWQPSSPDPSSPTFQVIRLYQKLLAFHQGDPDRSAFHDLDLDRLQFGLDVAQGEKREARFEGALRRFLKKTARHEISARAAALLGERLLDDEDPVAAWRLARRGLNSFSDSVGGRQCAKLLYKIEAPSATLSTESVWNEPWPTLEVSYRNLTELHFRVVAVDFAECLTGGGWGYGDFSRDWENKLRNLPPLHQWSVRLPPTSDFRRRTEHIPVPTTLPPGFYAILASASPDFRDPPDHALGILPVWVSDLALVVESCDSNGVIQGKVWEARSGQPVPGAEVWLWHDTNGWTPTPTPQTTDSDGRFSCAAVKRINLIRVKSHGHEAWAIGDGWFEEEPDENRPETVLFTDRGLYRPGQPIRYKGIQLQHQPTGQFPTLGREQKVTVVLQDTDGETVSKQTHVTNSYGSFSGEFTAPRDRLLGTMSLETEESEGGAEFAVEEYRRPKFRVILETPPRDPRPGETVHLTGRATALTGAPLSGAMVRWHVERETRLSEWDEPKWDPWARDFAKGTTTTRPDGTFTIAFSATPDPQASTEREPAFWYEVKADVTDQTGETRSSSHTIRIGYTTLRANLFVADWQTCDQPVEWQISTTSQNLQPQAAKGRLFVYGLLPPSTPTRDQLPHSSRDWSVENHFSANPEDFSTWKQGRLVARANFRTDATGKSRGLVRLPAGVYRARLVTKDAADRPVTDQMTIVVLDPAATRFPLMVPCWWSAPRWSVEPGETFTALWGTGYETGRAYVEMERAGRILQRGWTPAGQTQHLLRQPVTEDLCGGFTVRVTFIRENRLYREEYHVDVPWSNKRLGVRWDSFRSKLTPGQPETWTATVTGPDAQPAAAEMVAALYDASLDLIRPHAWPDVLALFSPRTYDPSSFSSNLGRKREHVIEERFQQGKRIEWVYPSFSEFIMNCNAFPVTAYAGCRILMEGAEYRAPQSVSGTRLTMNIEPSPQHDRIELDRVLARRNLAETAFFFPHLETDASGAVRIEFTAPEALTEWNFLGFAHDREFRSGLLTDRAVTAKDLMVEPFPPRFVREGDELEFTVKVGNQTDQPQEGRVRLTFTEEAGGPSADAALGHGAPEQPFAIPARQSQTFRWRIAVPEGLGLLRYRAVGATAQTSDGEEGYLPVLSRRVPVTESLPLPMSGPGTRSFTFDRLLEADRSDTLRHASLTVEMTSQPAWQAILALPYLMEFPDECSEQVFDRFYANALAQHLADSTPRIREVFDQWREQADLESPLSAREDLKTVLLGETPWAASALRETSARREIGRLCETRQLAGESARALRQLEEQQLESGFWPWFPGGRPSEFITLYIAMGFGRLRHSGISVDAEPAWRALQACEGELLARCAELPQDPAARANLVPTYLDSAYLYARSFFLADHPLNERVRPTVDFLLRQARQHWTRAGGLMRQAHLALALHRFGDRETSAVILRSLRERSKVREDFGRYWPELAPGLWWHEAPLETQSALIEAFSEIDPDPTVIAECQAWLLRQKQTRHWPSTKSTADAIHALLLGQTGWLTSDARVTVTLGGETLQPESTEAGTGFYEKRFPGDEVRPDQGHITVTKPDEGVSWGAVHWQYLEDATKLAPHRATPLQLRKALYRKERTARGAVLQPITGPLAVGDEVVVRLELRTDRDLEFVHLKDQRASGSEPLNVLSGHRQQGDLGYYETTRDTASHFFFDFVPQGTHILEYPIRLQHRGSYQAGFAEIQCLYAPEFNSRSENALLEVR